MANPVASATAVASIRQLFDAVGAEVGRAVVGQQSVLDRLLVGLLIDGHVLLEGPPGVAKTLLVRSLGLTLGLSFQRIQFTPDLLPADVLGTLIYNPKDGAFHVHQGPIFANLVLADEINRAPAKVQSALLEAMQERQVTLGNQTYPLPRPFLVLATQNPLEHEGTYPLPEAQLDRFAMQVIVDYPKASDESEVLTRHLSAALPTPRPVARPEEIELARTALHAIRLDPKLRDYIVAIVRATREPKAAGAGKFASAMRFGASPRAAVHLALAARALAARQGRDYVVPDDIKNLALDVLRHRLVLSYEAEADGLTPTSVVRELLGVVPVP